MPVFNDFNFSIDKLQKFRESLISNRGNLFNGNFPEYMDITLLKDRKNIDKIFVKRQSSLSRECGFIFNTKGTEKALEHISQNIPLKIYDDFSSYFRFENDEKMKLWNNTSKEIKKKIIALNINQMIRETNSNYRIYGDRLHYFTVGKITIFKKEDIKETKNYPLFLFACSDVDEKKQRIEIETKGFINFWLDKNIFDNEISNKIKGYSTNINEKFNSLLVKIQQTLKNITINVPSPRALDTDIKFDDTYSAIGIVTGFKPEYFDPVWDKLISINSRQE